MRGSGIESEAIKRRGIESEGEDKIFESDGNVAEVLNARYSIV